MALFVITDAAVFLGSNVLTDFAGEYDINGTVDMKERKWAAGGGFKHFLPGLNSFTTKVKGHTGFAAGEPSSAITPANRGQQYALTILPQNGSASAVGDTAVIHRGLLNRFHWLTGPVGEIAGMDLEMQSDLIQTVGFVGAPLANRNTTFTGAAVAVTGPTAAQRMYASLHVTVAAGTNLAVKVQSDDNAGFSSATDRITFTTVSGVSDQFLSVAGDLSTETHWRVTATISSGNFTFVAAFGKA